MKKSLKILLILCISFWIARIQAQSYQSVEYFFDNDPGIGNATPISISSLSDSLDLSLAIPSAILSEGAHTLYMRFQDTADYWSLSSGQVFTIFDSTNGASTHIVSGEYFFDTDPGIGNGISIASFTNSDSLDLNLGIPVANLSEGSHRLYYRFLDSEGYWSQIEERTFSIDDSTNTQSKNIVSGEYFFDTDPGVGNGISIANFTDTDSLDSNLSIPTVNLSEGSHRLYYRFLDSEGYWGQIEERVFNIYDSTNTQLSNIIAGEYFFDNDPDVGNATPVPVFPSMDSVNLNLLIIPSNLSFGTHHLFYRFIDDKGMWSQVSSDSINIVNCIIPTANFSVSNSCFGDSIPFTDLSTQTDTNTLYHWEILNNQYLIDSTKGSFKHAPIAIGSYSTKLIISNGLGCSDSSFQNFSIYNLPQISLGADTSICHNDSISLYPGNFASYLWNDNSTNSSLIIHSANTYWVKVTDSNQCSSYDSLILAEYPLPNINISGLNNSYCVNSPNSILTGTPFGGNFAGSGILDSIFYPNLAGTGFQEVYYQYTDSNSCSNIDTVQTFVNALPTVNISNSLDSTYCATGDSILLSASPSGGTFSGAFITNSNCLILNSNNIGNKSIVYQFTDNNNCTNSDTIYTIIYANPVVNFSGLANNYCSNDAATQLIPNIPGGTFQGLGMNGITFTPSEAAIGNNSIQYKYTSIHACSDSITHSTIVYLAPKINTFSATPNNFTSTPFISQFQPNVTQTSNYVWKWYFGDGATSSDSTPIHQYNTNGLYSVSLSAKNIATGCSDTATKTNYISCSGANPCGIDAKIWMDTLNSKTICPGDSFMLDAGNYNANYSYQWLRNGIPLTTTGNTNYYAKQIGYYQVLIYDGNCADISSVFFINHFFSVQPIIQQSGTLLPCVDDSIRLFSATAQPNYLWSTGETTSDIYVKTSGYYTLTIVNAQGCKNTSQPLIINASALNTPNLCNISVDVNSNRNKLTWVNDTNQVADSIKIYREGFIYNQFDLIASLDASTTTFYIDQNSMPKNRYYRYRISAIDSCGMETPYSNFHKSIHLMLTASGSASKWNLRWSPYLGRASSTYQIYRGMDSSQMQLLTQLPSNIHSYTDLNVPNGDYYYQIRVIFTDSCLNSENQYIHSALSNLANSANASGIGFHPQEKLVGSIHIFPNPNSGSFDIRFSNIQGGSATVELFNTLGQQVYAKNIDLYNGLNQRINLNSIAKGFYFIRIRRKNQLLAKEIMVIQ